MLESLWLFVPYVGPKGLFARRLFDAMTRIGCLRPRTTELLCDGAIEWFGFDYPPALGGSIRYEVGYCHAPRSGYFELEFTDTASSKGRNESCRDRYLYSILFVARRLAQELRCTLEFFYGDSLVCRVHDSGDYSFPEGSDLYLWADFRCDIGWLVKPAAEAPDYYEGEDDQVPHAGHVALSDELQVSWNLEAGECFLTFEVEGGWVLRCFDSVLSGGAFPTGLYHVSRPEDEAIQAATTYSRHTLDELHPLLEELWPAESADHLRQLIRRPGRWVRLPGVVSGYSRILPRSEQWLHLAPIEFPGGKKEVALYRIGEGDNSSISLLLLEVIQEGTC